MTSRDIIGIAAHILQAVSPVLMGKFWFCLMQIVDESF